MVFFLKKNIFLENKRTLTIFLRVLGTCPALPGTSLHYKVKQSSINHIEVHRHTIDIDVLLPKFYLNVRTDDNNHKKDSLLFGGERSNKLNFLKCWSSNSTLNYCRLKRSEFLPVSLVSTMSHIIAPSHSREKFCVNLVMSAFVYSLSILSIWLIHLYILSNFVLLNIYKKKYHF